MHACTIIQKQLDLKSVNKIFLNRAANEAVALKGNCGTNLPGYGIKTPFSEVISENSMKIGQTVQKL